MDRFGMGYPVVSYRLFAAIDGWFLHKLMGEQFHKTIMGQGHKSGFSAHQLVFGKMVFHDPQGAEIFGASLRKAVVFVIADTVHVMSPGIKEHDIWILV